MNSPVNFLSLEKRAKQLLHQILSSKHRGFYGILILLAAIVIKMSFVSINLTLIPAAAERFIQRLDIKKEWMRRKELWEVSQKPFLVKESVTWAIKEALNTHTQDELEFATQFKELEKLKGYESKLILKKLNPEIGFIEKQVDELQDYRTAEYDLSWPLVLTDRELKKLVESLEVLKTRMPAFFLKRFSFHQLKFNNEDRYQVDFTFIVREKKTKGS